MIEKKLSDETVVQEVVEGESEEVVKRKVDIIFNEAMKDNNVQKITVFKNCYRNRPCPCGSKIKFKRCCMRKIS